MPSDSWVLILAAISNDDGLKGAREEEYSASGVLIFSVHDKLDASALSLVLKGFRTSYVASLVSKVHFAD